MPTTLHVLPVADAATKRLGYLDNLRSFVIFLVIVTHTMVTYSGLGSWYYNEVKSAGLDVGSRIVFGLYGSFSQAWFMGILFFLAAFSPAGLLLNAGPRPLSKRGFSAWGSHC